MKNLTSEDLEFCEEFVKTFNYSKACLKAEVDRASMMLRLMDEKSEINLWIRNSIDESVFANRFVTEGVIKSGLVSIFMEGEDKHKLQSAKILMDMVKSPDKTKEFINLINAIRG